MLLSEATLLASSTDFARTIAADPGAYGLPADDATVYQTTPTRFADARAAWENPATHTPIQRALKDEAKQTLINSTRTLVDVCQAWPQMTDPKREALKIPLRDREPTPAHLPVAAPTATTLLIGPEAVRVIARDPAEANRRARPKGVKSVVVLATFTGNGSEPTLPVDQGPVSTISGRKTADLMWSNMPTEQTAWIACYWLSTRNERGPISEPQSIRVPGSRLAVRAAKVETTHETPMKIAA